jgi:hypothetical protein
MQVPFFNHLNGLHEAGAAESGTSRVRGTLHNV